MGELGSTPLQYRLGRLVVIAVLRTLFRFEILGRETLPTDQPYVVVANHLNWIDAFAILIALPASPRVHFVGLDTVLRAPKLSWLIRTTRAGFIAVPNDRVERAQSGATLMRRLSRCLEDGYPIVIFPEGSAGASERELMPFHSGFARLVSSTHAPLVPIALAGTRRLWWLKRVNVVIGPPLDTAGMSERMLISAARTTILGMMPEATNLDRLRLFESRLSRLIPALTTWTAAGWEQKEEPATGASAGPRATGGESRSVS